MYLVINEEMLSLGLKPIETMLLAQITSFKDDGCYMSVNTLKKMFNVSYNTIVRALDTLEKKNLIKRCGYSDKKTVLYKSLFKNSENNAQTDEIEDENEKVTNTTLKEEKDENEPNTDEIDDNTNKELTEEQKRELFIKEYSNKPYSFQTNYY